MASLGSPRATLKRARKDLANLKDAIASLQRGDYRDLVVAQPKPAGGVQYSLTNPLEDLSADIGVITGQLRAALDQLVHCLFELRKGHPPPAERRLQFPICKTQEDFRSRIKPDLEGLDAADIRSIEKAQPYHGGKWIGELKALAEEHKHRRLVYVTSTNRVQMFARATDTADAEFITLPVSGVRAPKAMYVNTRIAGPIAFKDATPVIEKLEILEARVTNIVDAFQALFD